MIFVFTYVNGFHDGCNVVATLIASRAMRPHPALAWAAAVEFLSPFAILVVGSSVSNTIQKLVGEAFYTDAGSRDVALAFITGGILAAILWNLTTWRFGIPASSSHALIGGVVGARHRCLRYRIHLLVLLLGKDRSDDLPDPSGQLSAGLPDPKAAADPDPSRWGGRQ